MIMNYMALMNYNSKEESITSKRNEKEINLIKQVSILERVSKVPKDE